MSQVQLESKQGLLKRFGILVVVVMVFAMVLSLAVNSISKYRDTVSAVLAEARTLNVQMEACWDYISSIQDTVNYDGDGNFSFKGVYCATAAKQIAEAFTGRADGYVIRYVRWNPRTVDDRPDDFEMRALEAFKAGQTEYYSVETYEGASVFRYASALYIETACLVCHGDPAGSMDPSGGYREGMQPGDLAGAASIVIPLNQYFVQARLAAVTTVIAFALLLLVIMAVLAWGLNRWVVHPMADANAQLGRENEAKDEFLATMSHELRTPLSSIIAYTDVWKNSRPHTEEVQDAFVDEISRNSHVLLNMVNNVIDSAKVNAGKYELEFEDVDIYDLVNMVEGLLRPLAAERNLMLQTRFAADVPLVKADWEALRKILTNLMANAIKYSDEGGTVTVRVRRDDSSEKLLVEVEDTGCGIPAEDMEAIFRKFEQSSSSRAGGSGLGLYLSRQLARMMGGDVQGRSVFGRGSVFWVELPLSAPEPGKE